jgi:hypothetical protein
VNWLIWTPVIVLGTLLLLLGLTALLGRVAGGRYLRPIVVGLAKLPFLKRLFERMSNAALERENPELASAIRKLQRFGTPTTPEAAQRALARLTPGERRAYMQAQEAKALKPATGRLANSARLRRLPTCVGYALPSEWRYRDHSIPREGSGKPRRLSCGCMRQLCDRGIVVTKVTERVSTASSLPTEP